MNSQSVDLFLNGPLGAWVLDQVDARTVGCVHSPSANIVEKACALGIPAFSGNASGVDYMARGRTGLSVHYPYLLKPHLLDRYNAVYNIHPGLLPWGKCYYPVFWALWADEPAGCTLHKIDAGIDTGNIVAQQVVPQYDWDTGGGLHRRVSEAEKGLFLEWWPGLAEGVVPVGVQQVGTGSFHYRREFFDLKARAQAGEMSGGELLRLIRCLSHEQYTGLLVTLGGRRYEVSMRPVG